MREDASDEIARLETEVKQFRTEVKSSLRYNAYQYGVMVLTAITAGGIAIMVSVVNQSRSEKKLCAVVTTTDDQYHLTPPTTELGKRQAENFTWLRRELDCPERETP